MPGSDELFQSIPCFADGTLGPREVVTWTELEALVLSLLVPTLMGLSGVDV